jgi:hypothetical protein
MDAKWVTTHSKAREVSLRNFFSLFFQFVSSSSDIPVFQPGDRIKLEIDRSKPSLNKFQNLISDILKV